MLSRRAWRPEELQQAGLYLQPVYNCAVSIIEGRIGIGKLIADDKVYYDLGQAVDQYAKF